MEEKDAASVKIFPPAVPLAVVIVGIIVEKFIPVQLSLGMSPILRSTVGWLIVVLSILVFGLWSVVLFRKGGQSENPWKPTTEIVEVGPYKFTRNPMYLQMILVCIGVSIALANIWILLLTPVGMFVLQKLVIVPEEIYLEEKFGESYLSYKHRVKRWF